MVKDWETSHLDGKCPSQVGIVYGRSVCFQVWSVSVVCLSGGGVVVQNQDRMARFSRQDGYSTVEDGNCNRQFFSNVLLN